MGEPWFPCHSHLGSPLGQAIAERLQDVALADGAAAVEVGKRANLLLLPEDPTKTIEGYARIDKIILGGRVIDPGELGNAGGLMGYESASQFSREYSRLFGAPPQRDIRRMRLSQTSLRQ